MGSIRTLLTVAIVLVVLPGLAAADDDGFARSGPYFGVGGIYTQNGQVEDEIDDALPSVVTDLDVDDSAGVNAVVGYRMLPWLAGELQYEYVDGFDITIDATFPLPVGPITQKIEVQSHLLTANLKAIVPISRVHPYLLVGAGFIHWEFDESGPAPNLFSSSETDFAGRAGVGIDFYLTRNIVLNAGANAVVANTSADFSALPGGDEFDYLFYIAAGAGLQYRF
jgi:opacity protein-like surface antigen